MNDIKSFFNKSGNHNESLDTKTAFVGTVIIGYLAFKSVYTLFVSPNSYKSANEEIVNFVSTVVLLGAVYIATGLEEKHFSIGLFFAGACLSMLYVKASETVENETMYEKENVVNGWQRGVRYFMMGVTAFIGLFVFFYNSYTSAKAGKFLVYILTVLVMVGFVTVTIVKRNREYQDIKTSLGFISLLLLFLMQHDHEGSVNPMLRGFLMAIFVCTQSYFGNTFIVDTKKGLDSSFNKEKCKSLLGIDSDAEMDQDRIRRMVEQMVGDKDLAQTVEQMKWVLTMVTICVIVLITMFYVYTLGEI